jgi:hypothetical protein
MKWCTEEEVDVNASRAEFLAFEYKEHTIQATFRDPIMKAPMAITKNLSAVIFETVKAQSSCKSSKFPLCTLNSWLALFACINLDPCI